MTGDRAASMLEILKRLRPEPALVWRDQTSRLLAMEDVKSIHGVEIGIAHLKDRVDRIETRLGLTDTEH